jgi:hypothetical protein
MEQNKPSSLFRIAGLFSSNKNTLNCPALFVIAIFIIALLVLAHYTFSQLQRENFYQNRLQAEA